MKVLPLEYKFYTAMLSTAEILVLNSGGGLIEVWLLANMPSSEQLPIDESD